MLSFAEMTEIVRFIELSYPPESAVYEKRHDPMVIAAVRNLLRAIGVLPKGPICA